MKKTTRLAAVTLGWILSFGVFASGEAQTSTTSEEQPGVIGLTLEDPKPDGCMTCHRVKSEEIDHRLITKESMQTVEKHRVSKHFADMETIPGNNEQGCISCHENFGTVMHQYHFANPEESVFIKKYYDMVGCQACHAFEQTEDGLGIVSKQGDVNWTEEDFKAILEENLY